MKERLTGFVKSSVLAAVIVGAGAAPAWSAAPDDPAARLLPRWQAMDANRDGEVSLGELHPLQAGAMRRQDRDGDGKLSLAEFIAFDEDPGNARALPVPANVALHEDLPYADTGNARHRVDVLLPRERAGDGPLPVIAYVHGGGWSMGSKVMARTQMFPLVASGAYAAVSIGYRLSWEAPWPAQIHDVKAGIRWIRAHAKDYGLDASRICAFGPSAGGHLVAMLGVGNGVASLEGTVGEHTDQSSDVQCTVDFFGPADLRDADGSPSMEALLLGGDPAGRPALAANASPVTHIDAQDVPFLIVHGTEDPLVSYQHSVLLADALAKAGVPVVFQTIEGGAHGDFEALPELNERIEAFLRQQLYGEAVTVPADTLVFTRGAPAP